MGFDMGFGRASVWGVLGVGVLEFACMAKRILDFRLTCEFSSWATGFNAL